MPAAEPLARMSFETVLDHAAVRSGIPTRTVWLSPESTSETTSTPQGSPTDSDGADAMLEQWTEVGEFEMACEGCGELIKPVVFMANRPARKRYVRRGDHLCSAADDRRTERALEAHAAFLENPPAEVQRRVQADTHLPGRFHAGLHRLRRRAGNEAGIEASELLLFRFQTGERSRGLYLWGDEGTGKSALTKALAFDLRIRTGNIVPPGWEKPLVQWGPRATVQWWFVPDLFDQMFRSWRGEVTEFNGAHVAECHALFLDDWGKEGPSDFKWRDVFRRVNERYDDGRATVYTSQYAPDELCSRMIALAGLEYADDLEALFARVLETCDVVELTGPSWRQGARR